MPFSILHISDLHRTPGDPISNDELVSALISDRDRYTRENPRIPTPQAIVVSGDIVQGVKLGAPNHEKELDEQYEVAEEFLDELTKRFLGGDRNQLIIVPGNHDVNWNVAFEAMEKVTEENIPKQLAGELYSEDSAYRWDWKTRTLYQVTKKDLYGQRLNSFWKFFQRFYAGSKGLLKVQPHSDANLFTLCGGKIGVAAFNSCHGNDCFAYHGAIRRDIIARSHLDFLDSGNVFDLQMAVWHHSIEGPPYKSDYMDVDIVRGMIGRGFRIGLYGHQHKTQITPHQVWLPDRERMAVISAGSLCAGAKELPTGNYRQYNILEIADDFESVRVHVRSMSVSNLFMRGILPDFGGASFAELDWNRPKNAVGKKYDAAELRMNKTIEAAEFELKSGTAKGAIELLKEIDLPAGSYQRVLMLSAATAAERWDLVVETIGSPQTIEEFVQLVDGLSRLKQYDRAKKAMAEHSARLGVTKTTLSDLGKRIAAEEAIHK